MEARQVIRILGYRGVRIRLEGDRLVGTPSDLLDDELRRLITRFRPELVAYLEAQRKDRAA